MLRVHLAKRLSSVARLARGRVGGRSATTAIAALPAHVARRLANTRSVRRSLGTNRCVSRAFSTKATKAAEVSVEEVYEKKTPIEHVLLRPGMYIGSVEQTEQPMWVLAESAALESESAAAASSGAASGVSEPMDRHFERKVVTYNPGLYKLFDEILVNAIDNHARDKSTTRIDVELPEAGSSTPTFSVRNNGRGIPVQFHAGEQVYVPEMVLGQLLTGSNFADAKVGR